MMEEGENRNGRGRALAIFWDLNSCPIPEGLNQADIVTSIVAALRDRVPDASNYDLQSFLAYGDPSDFPDHLLRTWERDGMNLLDACGGYRLYKRMIDGIVGFAFDRIFLPPRSSMIVVISAEKWPKHFLWYLEREGLGPRLVIPSDRATRWDVALGLTSHGEAHGRLLSNQVVDSLLAGLDKDKAEREAKKMKMTAKPTDDGNTSCPISPREPAQIIGTSAFFWCEYGALPSADQLHGLFSLFYQGPGYIDVFLSWLLVVELDDYARRNFELICEEGYAKDNRNTASEPDQNHPNKSSQPVREDKDEDEEESYTDFEMALFDYGFSFGHIPPLAGYDAYDTMLLKVLHFVRSFRPPSTIVFISEDAVAAFKEAGLVLYDWGAASRGEEL
ncbi:hypothetical protein MLD38_013609 [Melastoma candidum]|uniref:Uncharacterized protein n=1 Tax=Melastoma candidum TaxID=119954 RepID=A0ACB9RBE6_9MYRT|nr:hypothetical protein MLD38_013609 [Melastoma candidum]